MNIQIITSSYPSHPADPSGTAGLFVRSFALELQRQGHSVIIQPVGRKGRYTPDSGLTIEPLPWKGGDSELASLNLFSPLNWAIILLFFLQSRKKVIETHNQYHIDRTLCMWALPSGLLGYWMKKSLHQPYNVWALGSDIWKVRKIPLIGKLLLKKIMVNADHVFADGIKLCQSVKKITGKPCDFLPSARILLKSEVKDRHISSEDSALHFLFVGRYHVNKGPDILLKSFLILEKSYQERVRIHMYGLGPLKNSLEQFISTHNLEKYINLNDSIAACELSTKLQEVHYLIIPSRIESIPVIFSDALQMGTPVISMPVGDLKNLVQESSCGIVANEASPEALAQAIKQACQTNQRKAYSQAALKLAKEFNISNIVKKWIQLVD